MASNKRTDAELLDALLSKLDDEIASSDYPIDEVQRGLRAAGAEPNEIGRWGTALVEQLARKRWQIKATRTRDLMQAKLARRPIVATMPRADLLLRIEQAKQDPRLSGAVALAARNMNGDASSDEALRELVEDIEALAILADKASEE